MNIVIAYREQYVVLSVGDYDMLSNVQSRPSHLKRCKNEVIIYVENGKTYNKRQHVHNLLLAMTHCNCLETKTRRPRDDGIVDKWTQYMDSAMQKCGSKNDWQS